MMKYAFLAVTAMGLSLALSACGQSKAPAADEATTGPTGLTPAEQIRQAEAEKAGAAPAKADAAPGATSATGLAGVTRFTALGTEPFWNFAIDGTNAKYTTPENQAGTSFTLTRTDSAQGTAFAGPMDGKRVTILITPEKCSDGMSDNEHAYTVKAMIDGQELKGCANPA